VLIGPVSESETRKSEKQKKKKRFKNVCDKRTGPRFLWRIGVLVRGRTGGREAGINVGDWSSFK